MGARESAAQSALPSKEVFINTAENVSIYRRLPLGAKAHSVQRLLKNYYDTTICRSEAGLIDYRLCTERTFSAVSFTGGMKRESAQRL
jgi:hypothetical protein